MTDRPEPKFEKFTIEAGDYLLPGNDSKTLWRIKRGAEEHVIDDDGSTKEIPCWELWKWTRPIKEGNEDQVAEDLYNWDRWVHVENFGKMREAWLDTARLIPE